MTSRLLLPLLLLLLSAWAAAAATTGGDLSAYEAQFDAWCAEHGRAYATPEERAARLAVFADNAAFVAAHNAAVNSSAPSYTLALNAFAGLTHHEFRAARLRPLPDGAAALRTGAPYRGLEAGVGAVPDAVDWRQEGAVTKVKNQGSCGACWSFSATGAIEGINKIKTGSLISLSEQELIDCDRSYDQGCSGGLMDYAFKFIVKNGGIDTEEDYPFRETDGTCNKNKLKRHVVTIDGYTDVPSNNEDLLLKAVAQQPVSVGICGSARAFQPPAATNRASPPRDAAAGQADDSEAFSDIVLGYINRMLMAEDIDEKFEHYPEHGALLAAEKPFLEILAHQPASSGGSAVDSPDGSSVTNSCGSLGSCTCSAAAPDGLGAVPTSLLDFPPAPFLQPPQLFRDLSPDGSVVEPGDAWPYDPTELYPLPEALPSQSSSFGSSNGSGATVPDGFESLQTSPGFTPGVSFPVFDVQRQQAMQFSRGFEEASRFLPDESKLVIDFEKYASVPSLRSNVQQEKKFVEVKTETAEVEPATHRGRKHFYGDDLDAEEGRCTKHSAPAIDTDHLVREMMDKVLLCNGEMCSKGVKELREALQNEKHSHGGHGRGSGHGKGRGKKQPKAEVVDLETLLIHCAQSVATDDRRSATELLKQIRQHASPNGDGNQRLAHCFANGLEARLAGNGSQIYKSFTMTRFACTDLLKAYQLYLAACPFKKISHFFANQTIMNAAEKAKKVHIVDYGIYYGFQWPCLIQRLSTRPGGPPKLRITGIDTPQPGFRPAERIEETGRYLKDYAQTFNVPFEFQAVASRYEAVQIEDLHIEKDELLIVNCMFKFKTLMDESVVAGSPRNMVLNTIRKMNPHMFIHGIMNGSYNAPFFMSRFREVLFHYSAIFDMLEINIPRDNEQRLLIESALFGREAINVISCEGLERLERPETYKQWQVRTQRAGFKQLPMNQAIMKRAREKVRCYHKDFVIDEGNRWLLQGWKGRILLALSTWKPDHRSSS